MPPCRVKLEFSERARRRSTRTCGIQVHKLPAEERAGSATVAKEVGESAEKKGASCPATMEVRAQSKWTVAVRRRNSPRAAPFGAFGKPPAKSACRSPWVLAPATSGPKTSRPICDWRREKPVLL